MQAFFFILDENQYEYFRNHSHSELFHEMMRYEKYQEAKAEIDKLRKIHPDIKYKIYAIFTTLTDVDE